MIIVDDEPFNHESVKITLRSIKSMDTISYYNGKECIDGIVSVTTQKKVLAILMDVDMPIMDGISVTYLFNTLQRQLLI